MGGYLCYESFMSRQLGTDLGRYDVVVVGSGSAGSTAAIAAARAGAKILLLEKLPSLGGSSTAVLDTFYGFYTPGSQTRKVVSGIPDDVVAGLRELGPVIERPNTYGAGTGVTYLAEHLFEPLGMTDTGFTVPEHHLSRMAEPFAHDPDGGVPMAVTDFRKPGRMEGGGGGLVSTARDYARFLQFMLNKGSLDGVRLLGPRIVDYMTADHLGSIPVAEGASEALLPAGHGFGLGACGCAGERDRQRGGRRRSHIPAHDLHIHVPAGAIPKGKFDEWKLTSSFKAGDAVYARCFFAQSLADFAKEGKMKNSMRGPIEATVAATSFMSRTVKSDGSPAWIRRRVRISASMSSRIRPVSAPAAPDRNRASTSCEPVSRRWWVASGTMTKSS